LKHLIDVGFSRIVGTTTRSPRQEERQGIDYDFITTNRSSQLEEAGAFAELITFRGARYGVTKAELEAKLAGTAAPVVVVEPNGVKVYERYCQEHGLQIFKIFIVIPEAARLFRLNKRTFTAIAEADSTAEVQKLIANHTERVVSITGPEREWITMNDWDVIVPGDDVQVAIDRIQDAIKVLNAVRPADPEPIPKAEG
jgi:guanylate kinase